MKKVPWVLSLVLSTVALAAPTPFAEPPQRAPNPVIPPPNAAAIANSQPKPVIEYPYVPQLAHPLPPQVVAEQRRTIEQFHDAYMKQNQPRVELSVGSESSKSEPNAGSDPQMHELK